MADTRRTDRRYERKVSIEFKHGETVYTAHTRNVSLGGVFIETAEKLAFGSRVSLRFKLPTQTEMIEVEGQVRWLEAEEGGVHGIGVRFEGLRARDVWALNKFLERPPDPETR